MEPTVSYEPMTYPVDARGLVVEPIGADRLPDQRNVHLVITEPGCIRGNHYHCRGSEITVAFGPALFRYRSGDAVEDVVIPEGQVYRFMIPAGIAHAFKNIGQSPIILIGFNTEAHNPEAPDVVRDVLIEG